MSGIYIPGMEMPKNCAWCRFLQSTGPIPKRELFCGIDTTNNIHDYRPDKGCPLVPVPEHGDLIDRDELRKQEWVIDGMVHYFDPISIEEALTIIQADKEGEG